MTDNVFDQFDGPADKAAPTGKVEGPQPNVFDQFDAAPAPAPAAPVAAQPAPTPQAQPSAPAAPAGAAPQQDIKAQLGANPAAGDYGQSGPVGGTIQDQVQQAQQPQANPLGQAESQEHAEKVQQATKPPNLAENAIPQTVSPNPPPPPIPPAETPEQAQQAIGLPAGATRDANGIVHSSTVPHWLDKLMSWSQEAGNAIASTGAAIKQDIQNPGAGERTAVGGGLGVGTFVSNLGKAAGRWTTEAGNIITDPVNAYKDMALMTGNLDAYNQLSTYDEKQIKPALEALNKLAPGMGDLGKPLKQFGEAQQAHAAKVQGVVNDWATSHGVDPTKLSALGDHATLAGMAEQVGEQAPLLLASGGVGRVGMKTAMVAMDYADPMLMMAAQRGEPLAIDAIRRVTTMASTVPSMSFQTAYIAGVSGAEVQEQIRKLPFDQLRTMNPEFAYLTENGGDPEATREDLALRGAQRAQFGAILAMGAAELAGGAVAPIAAKAGPKVESIASSGLNNAAMMASLQASSNYGMQVADPSQSISQGVVSAGTGGAVVGALFGMVGGHGEPKAKQAAESVPEGKPTESFKTPAREALQQYLAASEVDGKFGSIDQRLAKISMLDRWAQLDGGRTSGEYLSAAKKLASSGELPDDVAERIGQDFNEDGTLSNAALHTDVRMNPDTAILHSRVPEDQRADVIEHLRQAGVNPYVTSQGDVTVLGDKDTLGQMQDALSQKFEGVNFNITENHYGRQGQGRPAAQGEQPNQGAEVGNEAGKGRGAENGPEPTSDEVGSARQVETPRSQPVIDRLAEKGIQAPVTGEGRVTVQPGNEEAIHVAAHDAAESGQNERKVPTPAQKEKGNYPKGKILFASPKGDIPVNIESPAGSIRKSLPGQPKWQRKLSEHYGYIPGTYSADGEPVDVIVGRKAHDDSLPIFVMHQTDKAGKFDEHKVVMGARTEREARDMYLKQYPQNLHESLLQGTPKMARFNREQFTDWMKSGNHDVPINPMSKRPMLALRTSGRMDVHFNDDVPYDKLDQIAETANAKFGTNLSVAAEGKGYRITGEVPKAKAPAIHRSLQRIEGHEQTNFNGNDVSEISGRGSQERNRPAALGAPEGRGGGNLRGQPNAGKPEEAVRNRPELGGYGEGSRAAPAEKAPPPPRWLKRVKTDAPVYAKGKGAHPVSVVGVHYSKVPELKELDTGMAGTGSAGAERRRYGMGRPQSEDQHRMYFYARQSNDLPEKEPVVAGTHSYEAQLNNLYDLRSDPEGIIDRLEQSGHANPDAVEEAIRDAGYDGFVHPGIANDTPVVQMLGSHKVPVKQVHGERFMFGGMGAKEPKGFERVGQMVNEGHPKEAIHAETGWHKGADGKWRFEIDDSKATINPAEGTSVKQGWAPKARNPGGAKLSDVLQHDELFKQYPALKDFTVKINPELDEGTAATGLHEIEIAPPDKFGGDWTEGTKKLLRQTPIAKIKAMADEGRPSLKSVLLHEVQHVIQDREGFARGGNPDEFHDPVTKELLKPFDDRMDALREKFQEDSKNGDIESAKNAMLEARKLRQEAMETLEKNKRQISEKVFDAYFRLAGENEARNVQTRLEMTPEERAAKHPDETGDYPAERQIVASNTERAPYKAERYTGGNPIEGRMYARVGMDESGKIIDRQAYEKSVEDYKHLDDTFGGRVISADAARELSEDYLADRTKSGDVHEPSSAFVKQYYKDQLAKPKGNNPSVLFMAGGTGSGKTTMVRQMEATGKVMPDVVYDTNTSNLPSSIKKIDQALASGRDVRIAYVYRDPVDAFVNGAVRRALKQKEKFGTGRTVPMNSHVATHVGSLETFKELRAHYAGDDRVDFKLLINDSANPFHEEGIDSLDNLTQSPQHIADEITSRLAEMRAAGEIDKDTYNGFRQVSESDAPLPGSEDSGSREAGSFQRAPAPREESEAQAHVTALQDHVNKIAESWKNAPKITVVRSAKELPVAAGAHLDVALGGAEGPEGMYYGGRVYLVGDAIRNTAHAEFVLAHEALGHYGLRVTFGDRLENLLNDIHDSIKDSPEFKEIEKRYADAYKAMDAREKANALTEEFLSDRAALQAKPSILKKVVAWVRNWARQQGLVSRWTPNDILSLLDGAAANVRQGRASAHGWPGETATFDPSLSTRQSYTGAAGEGTITHNLDGSRSVELGGLKADLSRVMTEEGTGMLVDKLDYQNPSQLLAITRLAGEEAKAYILWPESARGDLEAAGVPTEVVGNRIQTPASRVGDQPARFSIRNQPADETLRDRINRVLQVPESSLSPWDRFQHWARKLANFSERRDSFIQAAADQYRAIARDEMKLSPNGTLLDASESAYKMAWMSNNTREVMGAVMHLGVPQYKDGGFSPVAGRKGLMDILMPLYQHEEKGMDRMFEFYAMGRRADQLSKQTNPDGTSKEKLLTADDIKAAHELGEKYPVLKQVFDDWQTFNKQVLDLAVERGNMTAEMADLWKQNDYVPFYRVADEDGLNPKGKMPGGLKVSSKRLTGSDRQVEPIIENIIGNTQAVLRKVYKNEALRRTAAIGDLAGTIERMPMKFKPIRMSVGEIETNLEKMGLFVGQQAKGTGRSARLQITPAQQEMWTRFFRAQEPMGKDVFTVMENGKPVYYKVNDHLLAESVNSIQKQTQLEGWFRTIFTTPKNFLTHAITLNPAFMLRHLERQVTHTFVQSGENFNPFSNAVSNAKDAYNNSEFMQRMAMAGAGGNEYYDIDQMREAMRGMGTHSTILDTGHKVWMAYRKIGFVADQMNRMGIAKAVLKRGGSTAEAAWQAQDLLNFRMHGGSNIMRHLIGAVPFLNARVQGLYRIARGAAGADQSFKSRRSAQYAFIVKSAALIAASQFMALRNNGDPRYERLPDEMKANYWHIFVGNYHFAIAKPFEIGALFSTLPDSAVRYAEGLDGSHTFANNLYRVIETVFRIDPIPGTVKPLLDDWRNKDDLTQRPIVPESVQHLDPAAQVNPYTSPTLSSVAQHMPEFAPDILRSPLRFQHLVQGYTGALGLYTIEAADAATRAAGYAPKAPASHFGFPGGGALETMAGSMFGKVDTDAHNRYVGMIYEDKQKLDQIAQTIKAYQKAGDIEGLNRYYMQHKSAAQYQAQVMAGYRAMTQYNHEERAIYTDPRMSPEEKRERLDALTKDKTRLLENLAPVLNQADSAL